MSFFTWKDKGLTSDCSSLDAMASRFEETANLMKKLSKKGFKLKKTHNNQLILHPSRKDALDRAIIRFKQMDLPLSLNMRTEAFRQIFS